MGVRPRHNAFKCLRANFLSFTEGEGRREGHIFRLLKSTTDRQKMKGTLKIAGPRRIFTPSLSSQVRILKWNGVPPPRRGPPRRRRPAHPHGLAAQGRQRGQRCRRSFRGKVRGLQRDAAPPQQGHAQGIGLAAAEVTRNITFLSSPMYLLLRNIKTNRYFSSY